MWKGIRKRKAGTNAKTSAPQTHLKNISAQINVNHLQCIADRSTVCLIKVGGGGEARNRGIRDYGNKIILKPISHNVVH